jgi:hypothetical protein
MSKKERTHGEQMNTLGAINALYEMINIMFDKAKKLEIIVQEDERKEKERENAK